ncbi:TetR/AcrR family transcriptional regulator [uncultured Adlercreutzia sp.]|uniref:TetR/AcrR family transcriptional regulator n=1 Tax=uncultured Adlercreutzia sp. TaxID=875803 RepID=UPI0026F3981A|nr:TetR/AcrR family transcriptional regulator [uncultured Adlercreutzia sp.]
MARQKGKTSKADVTRRQLLDAALAVVSERGYAEATVDRIVEVAGVSKGVAYYHFESKDAMVACLLEEGLDEIIASFEEAAASAPCAREALVQMAERFAALIFENADFARFLLSELWRGSRPWSAAMAAREERLLGVLRAQIKRGQGEGTIRREIDPDFEAVAIVGMVLTTTLHSLRENDEAAAPDQGRRLVNQICDYVHHANMTSLRLP